MEQQDQIQDKREELLRMRKELNTMLADLDAELERLDGLPESQMKRTKLKVAPSKNKVNHRRIKPVRALVLDTLEDLGFPAYSREIALYCQAWNGRELKPERFGSLSKDEYKAYTLYIQSKLRPRSVWLCHGLTHDRYQPIKRLWARSDWPLKNRIIAPTTGRVQHLKITSVLCDLALRSEGIADDPEKMRIIAADHARDLPGIDFRRGKFELEKWRDTAHHLLQELLIRDEEIRKEAANRLSRYPEIYQLFGLPEIIEPEKIEQQSQIG